MQTTLLHHHDEDDSKAFKVNSPPTSSSYRLFDRDQRRLCLGVAIVFMLLQLYCSIRLPCEARTALSEQLRISSHLRPQKEQNSEPISTNDDQLNEILRAQHAEESWDYPEIDMVYTWVNGSDPEWLQQKIKRHESFLASMKGGNITQNDMEKDAKDANGENRFRTHDELKYSLRSVEKYAPWIRHIHIVVADGQVPAWLNTSHPKIRVVSHSTIFQNPEYLPTFNSNGIESQLPYIPDLANYFIYANDDMFFGNHVHPRNFFVTPTTGQQLRYDEGWPVKRTCAKGCSYSMLQNNRCDDVCNVPECNWDYGDCGGLEKLQEQQNAWTAQFANTNHTFELGNAGFWELMQYVDGVYNREFNARKKARNVIRHMPHLKSKVLMKDMVARFQKEFDWTASHPFRHEQDMQSCFSYDYYLSAVQVYAPTAQQAWKAAFDTVGDSSKIFLYGHLPRSWDSVEYARYQTATASSDYAAVKDCTKAIVSGQSVNADECSEAMGRLVSTLRLPFAKDALGKGSLVDFRILYNKNASEERETIKQLKETAAKKKKFITVNDDMKQFSPAIEKAMKDMYQSFFPAESEFELRE